MRARRIPTWIAATSLVAALAATAHAQSAEAESLFNDGDSLMKQGKLAEACDAFAASNRIEARAGTLIRLGECREKNHELASAWSAYKDALGRVKDPKKKEIAQTKAAELEKKLSYLTVNVPDGSKLDGLQIARNGEPFDNALWNRAIPVNGGKYTIVARAPKHGDWQKTIDVPEAQGKIVIDIPKLDEPNKAQPVQQHPTEPTHTEPTQPTQQAEPPPERDTGEPSPSMWTGKRKVAVALGGVAIAGVAIGAVLGSSAKGKQNNAYNLCPDPQTPCGQAAQANQLISDGKGLAMGANITFGVAGAAAIGAAILWFTGAPVVPTAGADHAGLALVGQF